MFNENFSEFLEGTLKKTLSGVDLKDSLDILGESILSYYKDIQVSFAKSFGRRLCYITGAGEELYEPNDKIQVLDGYFILIQNSSVIPELEKEIIISLVKLIIAVKCSINSKKK
ncbi:hypothetical protein CLOACE_14420 [Clostridium acetireducens DSM 10703]|jgi:hypothetical protein|uniref:Uncharacterized protein n=1 Tax=Clostridium acetireducens DSM 10703 TaxID=1121290 RepID=A0A1E8EYX2_9CLOT|nr:hypothetical protein [Clostridium acetireducens]OFI05897.1 hypothetical protein CLOACE_14420 [Clostridium acetireducens DSM 10703]